ncbi:alpha/beta fold hydrolase [Hyalangium rubrum]|uniref:Alpha/beta hydrolase n=1 Tax=Hyalangium rubrum TaxID=3103134 RepID=A0ABU5HFI0_9BACT|nr:alpha/beta hydrolase [Hyalangium sp. s54d21]MDY7231907.1 alpha/beta hydrolase [Hyalangium sp. s54d21]
MQLSDWKREGRFFSFEGHRIFYRDEGVGEVLLCLHGFPTSSWDWSRLWPGLIPRFRVIAPDLLGYGFSDKPPRHGYSLLDQATLTERLLASLGITHVHVLSHDFGVSIVQELLARQLEQEKAGLTGLVLRSSCFLNGGLFPEVYQPRVIQRLLASPVGALVSRLVTQRSFERSFTSIFGERTRPSKQELQEFWEVITHNGGSRIAHRHIRFMEERHRYRERWTDALQRTRVPLRMVNGAADPVSGAHMAARYRELVPHPDIVSLEGIGHYPMVEAPRAVLEAVLAFMAGAARP